MNIVANMLKKCSTHFFFIIKAQIMDPVTCSKMKMQTQEAAAQIQDQDPEIV